MKNNYTQKKRNLFTRFLFTILMFAGIWDQSTFAQVSAYGFSSSSGTYTPISGGTVLSATGVANDDNQYSSVPIGFSFTYNGTPYTTIGVNSNGYVALGGTAPGSFYNGTSIQNVANAIHVFSEDLHGTNAACNMQYLTTGSVGSRVFTLQWSNWGFYNTSSDLLNFQLQLFETSNTIKFVYNPTSITTAQTCQVGLTGATVADFNSRTTTTNWAATTASAVNTAQLTYTNVGPIGPTAGLTYTFTTPPPCVTPTAQPTALLLTPFSGSINGSFSAASPAADGYLVVRYPASSTPTSPVNGTTYTVGGTLGLGTIVASSASTSFVAAGLAPSTSYDFYIYSMNNLCSGGPLYLTTSPLFGNQSTTPPGNIQSTSQGGLWSSTATWVGGALPSPVDNVIISDGSIVTIDQVVTVGGNLTIGQGTSGVLQWNATANALTVTGNILVSAGGRLLPYTASTAPATVTINCGGNFTNNGYVNLGYGVLIFNGSQVTGGNANPTLSGSGTFQADNNGKGIIRALQFATNGNSVISTSQNLITSSFAHTAGNLNTNGKLTIDNTWAVYGQSVNGGLLSVSVTGMGVAYSAAPVVFGAAVTPWNSSTAVTLNSRYFANGNVYLCTTAGTTGAVAPSSTSTTPFADGTATLLYIGPLGTLGNPFQVTAVTLGTQYFFNGALYSCTVAGTPTAATAANLLGVVGTTYTSGTATFICVGTPARVGVNYDATTQTVRSLSILNAGSGYTNATSLGLTFNIGVIGGTVTTAATAVTVIQYQIVGAANSLTQKSGSSTITGGLTINNTAGASSFSGVGSVSATNGGTNYTVAPSVGFGFPTGINLVTSVGSGYTVAPTGVTITGGTTVTGFTNPTFTITVNQGKVVSIYCATGGSGWLTLPTLTVTGGTFTTQATAAFPVGCLATATASMGANKQVTTFTVTNAGFGYVAAPTIVLAGGTFSVAAATVTCRLALYNLTYNNFTPSANSVVAVPGAELPSNNKLNALSVATPGMGANFSSNLEIFGSTTPLTLTSVIDMGGNNLLFSWNGYAGLAGSLTARVKNGSVSLTTRGGGTTGSTLTYPFDASTVVFTGTGTAATGASVQVLKVSQLGAPSGSSNSGVPIGNRSYRIQTTPGDVWGTNPTVTLNWNANDGLNSDQAGLFVAQSTATSGPWTVKSLTTGTAGGALAATGSRVTATVAPGPISMTGDDYFTFVSTFNNTPLAYNVIRTQSITYNSIMSTGTIGGFTASASTDDATTPAITIPGSTFIYQGQTITGFNICTNGWIKLISASSPSTTLTTFTNVMGASGIGNIIAPFWEDLTTNPNVADALNTNLNASIRYQINGSTPGSRQIIVEWKNMTVFGAAGPQLSFQIVLDETNNSITFNYGLFQGFNGTNNHRYTYTCGIGGILVNGNALSGQCLVQQYENSDVFGTGAVQTANVGANGMMIMPDCNSSISFVPGAYAGGTIPSNSAPFNDEPSSPITLIPTNSFPANLCGAFFTSRNATATTSVPVCSGNNDDDVWFKFTAQQVATTVRVYGSGGYLARVQVFDGTSYPTLIPVSPVMCNVATGGGFVDASMSNLVINNVYYVRVYHDGGGVTATGTCIISGGAVTAFNFTNTGTGYVNTTTGSSLSGRCYFTGGGGQDACYNFNTTAGSIVSFTGNGGYGYTSAPTVTVDKPDWGGINGQFAIIVYSPVPNDDCSGAVAITNINNQTCVNGQNSITAVNTISCTPSPQTVCSGIADDDIWYKFDAIGANTSITVTGNGGYNPVFELWNGGVSPGSCAGTSVACINSTGVNGVESSVASTIPGNTYYIRVYHAASGAGGLGATFDICVYTPVSCPVVIGPANSASVPNVGTNLSWNAVAFATGYDVYLSTVQASVDNQLAGALVSANQAGTSYSPTLATNTVYYWRVIAKNGPSFASSGCTTLNFNTNPAACISAPTAPLDGSIACSNSNFTLSWPASLGATGYDVYLNTGGGLNLVSSNQAGLTYNAGNLALGGPYSWRIDPVNSNGTPTGCNVWTFTVAQTPAVPIVAPTPANALICTSGSVSLNVTNVDPLASYAWTPTTSLTPANGLGTTVSAAPTVTVTYTVTSTIGTCSATATQAVTFATAPTATAAANPNITCSGGTSSLSVIAVPGGGTGTSSSLNYTATSIPIGIVSPVGSPNAGPVGDDVVSSLIPLGFSFNYYGVAYTQCVISTNGFISFDAAPGSGCCAGQSIPNSLTPNNVIALDWMDLNTNNGGTIDYFNLTLPNRFVVRFNNVATFSSTGTVSGEIILYDNGFIEIHSSSITTAGATQTQGLENVSGTLATPVTGRNAAAWNATNDAYRFSQINPAAFTYNWNPGGATTNPTNVTLGASTSYTVTVTEVATGCTASSSTSVLVTPTTGGQVTITNGNCGNGNIILNLANYTTGGALVWEEGPVGGPYTPIAGGTATTNPYSLTQSSPIREYRASVTCGVTVYSTTAIATKTFTATLSANPSSVCGQQITPAPTVTFTASPTGGSGSYSYSYQGYNIISVNANTTTANVNAVGTNSYVAHISDNATGCQVNPVTNVLGNSSPTFTLSATPSTICSGSNSQLLASGITIGSGIPSTLSTPAAGGNGFAGNVFDIVAGALPVTIHKFSMGITAGTLAEIWYKAGGYGCTTSLSSSAGWTLVATAIPITPAGGSPALTLIDYDCNITIPAGQTYGWVVVCNGSNYYTNGTTVCTAWASDANLSILQGLGGSAYTAGTGTGFSFLNSPRNFNGSVTYDTGNSSILWSPGATLNSTNIINPVATPASSTLYTAVVTNTGTGCYNSASTLVTVTPAPTGVISGGSTVCGGQSSSITVQLTGTGPWNYTVYDGTNSVVHTSQMSTSTFSVTPSGTTTYTLTAVSDQSGCTGTFSGSALVTVNPQPVGGTTDIGGQNSTVLCAGGGSAVINLSGSVGSIVWQQATTSNGPWTTAPGSTNSTTYNASVTATTYFRALLSNTSCYDVASTTVVVYVNPASMSVTSTLITDHTATITWSPYSANASYTVSYNGSGGPVSIPGAVSPLAISGLAGGTLINVTVTQDIPVCGVTGNTSFTTMCSAPTGLVLSNPTSNGFTATWTAVPGATGYQLYYRGVAGNLAWSSVTTTNTTYTFPTPSLVPNAAYSVYVVSLGCGSGSYPSAQQAISTTGTSCGAPTITATSGCANQITINVTAGAGTSIYYTFRKIYPVVGAWYGYTSNLTTYTATLPGLPAGGEIYEVWARNVCTASPLLYSPASNQQIVTTPLKLPAPNNVVISQPTCNGFTVAWNAVAGATGYQVYYKKSTATNYSGYAVGLSTVFTFHTLTTGNYNVYVVALGCNNLQGASSAIINTNTQTIGCRSAQDNSVLAEQSSSLDNSTLNVFPNPNDGQFSVEMTLDNDAPVTLEVINVLGQVIYSSVPAVNNNFMSTVVNLKDSAAGIYYVRITQNGVEYLRRVMVAN